MKITDLLYVRLISHIRNFSNSKMKVGVELEYPIVHKQAKNIEKNIIENLFKGLLKAGFKPLYSSKSQLIGAEKQNEIVITLDTSYNNLELAFAPQPSLLNIEKSLTYYLQIIRNYLQANGYSLIDKGLNPDFASINSTLIDDEEIKAECNFWSILLHQTFMDTQIYLLLFLPVKLI